MLKYILCLTILASYSAKAACPKGCKHPLVVYEELGCVPRYKKADDCCPDSYDCSEWFDSAQGSCVLKGRKYGHLEKSPVDKGCFSNCTCQGTNNYNFECQPLICPEYHYNELLPKCYHQYDLGECCSTGVACHRKPEIFNCTTKSRTYVDGQRFTFDQDKCMECVCKKGFTGLEPPFCRRIPCYVELISSFEVKNYYGPIYKLSNKCCPAWLIPNGNENIIPAPGRRKPGLKCRFGRQILNIGDTFVVEDNKDKIKCVCQIPPFITCYTSKIIQ